MFFFRLIRKCFLNFKDIEMSPTTKSQAQETTESMVNQWRQKRSYLKPLLKDVSQKRKTFFENLKLKLKK